MKNYLLKLISRKKKEIEELKKRSAASNDLAEVRAIGETLAALKDEIDEAEKQLAEVEKDDNAKADDNGAGDNGDNGDDAQRAKVPADAQLRNAQVVGSFGATQVREAKEEKDLQYRNAFMEFVLRGTAIPAELRDNTTTSDVASVIPTQLVNQIVEKFDNVGMILPLITKTSYKAGVEIPISTVKPAASWVAEGAGSDRQKKTTGKVTFTYFKLRCEISMTMEVGTMALAAFEAKFVENVAKAMVYAIENSVINGTGSGQPKGILASEVPAGQTVEGALSYAKLAELEGVIPTEYETGAKYCMNKRTFAKIQGMVDQQ